MADSKPWETFSNPEAESRKPWEDFGGKTQPERSSGFRRAVGDTAVAAGAGALTGAQLLANAAGADGRVAQRLGDAADFVRGFESAERRAERQTRAEKIREAEESGSTWEEVKANVGAFTEAPIDTTVEALGTSVPTLAAAALTKGRARGFVGAGVGAAQGAGAVKGSIYDAVEQEALATGESPEEAARQATEAQAYSGENTAQIGLGAGLGAVAGTTGVEGAVRRLVGREAGEAAARGVVRSTVAGAAREAPLEAAQGGQERLAANLALQNEGYEVDPMTGVAGAAALEGLAGGAAGAGVGAVEGYFSPEVGQPGEEAAQGTDVPPNEEGPTPGAPGDRGAAAAPEVTRPPTVPDEFRVERAGQPVEPAQIAGELPASADRPAADGGADVAPTPSEQMGLSPDSGPLSAAAVQAVDGGATAGLAQQAAAEEATGREAEGKGVDARRRRVPTDEVGSGVGAPPAQQAELGLAVDRETELRGRLDYLTRQARARGGWNRMLAVERDRAQQELDALAGERGVDTDSRPSNVQEGFQQARARQRQRRSDAQTKEMSNADEIEGAPQPTETQKADPPAQRQESLPATADTTGSPLAAPRKPSGRAGPPASGAGKQPWEMTRSEWDAEREAIRPNTAQSRFTRASASQATSNAKRLETLLYGVNDAAKAEIAAAQDEGKKIAPDRLAALMDQINTPVGHRRVIEKALAEGKPVPGDVLADYPDLSPRPESGADRVDQAAAQAEVNPTEAQKEAGNYRKGRVRLHGLEISIENPRGSTRSGTRPDGSTWRHEMSDHYGYIRRTKGADSEHVDVYVGPKPESKRVYVIDQLDQPTGQFDEHKVMMGYPTKAAATKAYRSNFDKGWKVGPVQSMSVDEFKSWLKDGDTTRPASEAEGRSGKNAEAQQAPNDGEKRAPARTMEEAEQVVSNYFDWLLSRQPNRQNPAPGVHDGNSFQMDAGGAPFTKKGEVMVNGHRHLKFRYKTLWEAAKARAMKSQQARDVAQSAVSPEKSGSQSIKDLGEKIGGARKDNTAGQGPKKRAAKPKDDRPAWARRFEVNQIVREAGRVGEVRNEGRWVIRDKRRKDGLGQARSVGHMTFESREQAEAALPLIAVSLKHRVVAARNGKYEIWRDINDRKRVKVVDQAFESRDAAMQYMAEHAKDIIETNTTFGEGDIPTPPDRRRQGAERRKGNVEGRDFVDRFGFRGVEFGNWNNQDDRQGLLNDAFDGLMDLADILGVPPEALSLNGDLALAFGARGHGLSSARAHYEPDKVVINLTKEHGAGTLAHEWFHALDHHFGRLDGKASSEWGTADDGTRALNTKGPRDMASHGFKRQGSGARPELREAYEKLIQGMFRKAETYVEDTARVDQFLSRARGELDGRLKSLRADLAEPHPYQKRKNKPASSAQLAEFDAIAQRMMEGEPTVLSTKLQGAEQAKGRRGLRMTNEALESLSALYKSVRGRAGFRADGSGVLDRLRGAMNLYKDRLRMAAQTEPGKEKVRSALTDFAMNAKELDQGRGTDYWTTPHEMAARAFQGYVEDQIAEQGNASRFLNYAPENQGIPTPWGIRFPFPRGKERKAINALFDEFIGTLRTEKTDKGTLLFSLSDEDRKPGRPERSTWGGFPPVIRNGDLGQLNTLPGYEAAKAGDAQAAMDLVESVVSDDFIQAMREAIGEERPIVVPVVAEEASGRNKIPSMFAAVLADRLGLEVSGDIVQVRKASRTGQGAYHRLAFSPGFDGPVGQGQAYLIVDDTLTMGGTLASLRGFIENRGGRVLRAAVLTAHEGALSLPVTEQMLRRVRAKHGDALEQYWQSEFGYGLDQTTQGEAGHLRAAPDVDAIRDRIAEARQQAGDGLGEGRTGAPPQGSQGRVDPAGSSPGAGEDRGSDEKWRLEAGNQAAARRKPSISLLQANAVARRLNQMNVPVEAVKDTTGLPDAVRRGIDKMGVQHRVQGVYHAGKAWLVADNLRSVDHAYAVALHEVVGHAGVKAVLGDQLAPVMQQIYRSMPVTERAKLRRKYAAQLQRESKARGEQRIAEEYVAHLAETDPRNTLVQRVVSAIRALFRRLFPGIQWTTADLLKLLADSRRHVGRGAFPSNPMALSLADVDPASTDSTMFSLSDEAPRTAPRGAASAAIGKTITRQLKGRLADLKPAGLGALPLMYLRDFAPRSMTALNDYIDQKRLMDADRNEMHARYDAIAQRWLKERVTGGVGDRAKAMLGLKPVKPSALDAVMHDATIAGIDPSRETMPEGADRAQWMALRKRFQGLPAAQQVLFADVRDAYRDQITAMEEAIEENIRKSSEFAKRRAARERDAAIEEARDELTGADREEAIEKANRQYAKRLAAADNGRTSKILTLRQKFESMRVDEPYFPLKRFGDYFVALRDQDGELQSFSMFEKAADMEAAAEALRELHPGMDVKVGRKSNKEEMRDAIDPSFVADIQELVADQLGGVQLANTEALTDSIYQLYLETLPDFSMRKNFIHRKKTPGFDQDAMRAFASTLFHSSHQVARLKHKLEMDEMVEVAEEQARRADDPTDAMTVANELRKRHEWVMNPQGSALAQRVTSAAFIYQLGLTPAAAMVNMSQTFMLGVPVLGTRFNGEARATAELLKASKDFLTGRGQIGRTLSGDEKAAMAEFERMGLIEKTQAHDLAGVGDTGVEYSAVRQKIMGAVSWMYHHAERYNREVTSLAAYRMARAAGMDHKAAIKEAADLTWTTHFDYSSGNRARYMQNDTAKVLLVFRQHSINMLSRLAIDVRQMVKGESPAVRREAARRLAGIYGMFALMAGMMGVPGAQAVLMLLNVMGDDDDPWTTEDKIKRAVTEALGEDLAAAFFNGVPGTLTDTNLTNRIGLGHLWFFSPNRELEGRDAYVYWMEQVLGAAPAMVANTFSGASMMSEGHTMRGLETMMPKAGKDLLRSIRYGREGVQSLNGYSVVDEVSGWSLISQAIGFTPAHIIEQYERNASLKNAEQRILRERRNILNRYALAMRTGDTDMRSRLRETINDFNRKNPAVMITYDTIRQSMIRRATNRAKAGSGVLLDSRLDYLRREAQGA